MKSSTKKSLDLAVPFIGVAAVGYSFIGKNKDRDIKYTLFVIVLVGIALYALTSAITKYFLERSIANLPSTAKAEIISSTGIAGADYDAINDASVAIYEAFHSSWDEDEDAAIDAIKTMKDASMVKALCQVYFKKYGLSLKVDFNKYLNYFDMLRVPDYVKSSWS